LILSFIGGGAIGVTTGRTGFHVGGNPPGYSQRIITLPYSSNQPQRRIPCRDYGTQIVSFSLAISGRPYKKFSHHREFDRDLGRVDESTSQVVMN
jgi:hypothetical protein